MTKLSVNVNKVATLRNTRHLGIPSPTRAALLCVEAGAHGITVHPRPDQRHIRPEDVFAINQLLARFPAVEYNIEGNPDAAWMALVKEVRPHQATLVPDAPDAFTSDHGWDVGAHRAHLTELCGRLKDWGCRVSLFVDPVPEMMALAAAVGADRVELYTEPYAAAFDGVPEPAVLARYTAAAQAALDAGLGVNAGHDLNQENLGPFLAAVPGVDEVSIGHALIADALEYGLPEAVRRYLQVIAAR